MPEYVLDSRGRRRSVLLSMKECRWIASRLDELRHKLEVTDFPADAEQQAVAVVEQRVRAAAATGRVPVAAGPRAGVAVAERAKVCGARVVSREGKTVACLLTLREFNLLADHLEWLEDSLWMQEARAEGPGETIEFHELMRELGLEPKA